MRMAVIVSVAASVGACVDVNGGAVEVSWTIRTSDGTSSNCADSHVGSVELCMQACDTLTDGACDDPNPPTCSTSWSCEDYRGTTRFDVSPGRKKLWIQVICSSGSAANVRVPDPTVSLVRFGEVTDLRTQLIVVETGVTPCGFVNR